MANVTELKPCPFCGERLEQDQNGYWKHPNNDCYLANADSEYCNVYVWPDEYDAWNRRSSDEQ